jgi:hypothetical protein
MLLHLSGLEQPEIAGNAGKLLVVGVWFLAEPTTMGLGQPEIAGNAGKLLVVSVWFLAEPTTEGLGQPEIAGNATARGQGVEGSRDTEGEQPEIPRRCSDVRILLALVVLTALGVWCFLPVPAQVVKSGTGW